MCQGSEDADKDRETSNSPFKAHMNSSTMEDTVKLIIAYAEDPEVSARWINAKSLCCQLRSIIIDVLLLISVSLL